MVSVIIAAYDEGVVLGATLDALRADAPEAEVVVVANGCHDDTAEVARRRPGVRVVELPDGGKARALAAGEEVATSFPRIYLDADMRVPRGTVAALCRALEQPGVLAAVPARRLDAEGRPWPVRAHSQVHERLPLFRDALFGRGLVALSEHGRACFGTFPDMVADDLFLDSLFTAEEKLLVDEVVMTVATPTTTRELVRRLARVRRGSSAMRTAATSLHAHASVRRPDRWSWLRDVVARDPHLLPAGAAYAALTVSAALLARRSPVDSLAWGRVAARGHRGRVGLLGVQYDTANLGLAALAYSLTAIVDTVADEDTEIVVFSINSEDSVAIMRRSLGTTRPVRVVPLRHRSPRCMLGALDEMRRCDVVIDLTGGDSFSDIYGGTRLMRKLLHKQMVLTAGTPLVLGPQTYGPLRRRAWRPWYRHVVDHATLVATRDVLSAEFLSTLTPAPVVRSTDVAVLLPTSGIQPRNGNRVGLNVSGLLWNGGYTGSNQFSLTADYRAWCDGVVEGLVAKGYEVHLVPHVIARAAVDAVEDDVTAAQALMRDHPTCTLAPAFDSPVAAKSHIAGLDVFIGSRMHATIAAFTAGVPTVPVAYSRKFAGFFGSLGYDALVDLTDASTDEAVAHTLALVEDRDRLSQLGALALGAAGRAVDAFVEALVDVLPATVRNAGHDVPAPWR